MALSNPRYQSGLQLLEAMVLVSVIGLLMFIAAGKVLQLRADVERTMLQRAVDDINATLALQAADHMIDRQYQALRDLHHSNPVDLIQARGGTLEGYIGERYGPDPASIDPGQWYFDSQQNMLIYRVRHAGRFDSPLEGPARARFQSVISMHDSPDGSGRPGFRQASLQAVEPYRWQQETP